MKRNENWPVLYWTTCEVTECVPGEVFEFAVVMRDRPVNTWRYEFHATDDGGTDVTESFDLGDNLFTKLWRPLGGFLRERRNQRDMLRTLERVKAVAEGSASRPRPPGTHRGGAGYPRVRRDGDGSRMSGNGKLRLAIYEQELEHLQLELVRMLEWIRHSGHRLVVIFEGRDAAGKGSTISRLTDPLNPRACRVVALPKPTEREETQWYFQRYVAHLPSAGEMVVFDRSWYNRAGVERVLGFCTDAEYWEFMRAVPEFERMLVRSGIQIVKYWFSVSHEVQTKRFKERLDDPAKRWKYSDIDARIAGALERVLAGQGHHDRAHARSPRLRGGRSTATTSGGPGSTRSATCCRSCHTRRSTTPTVKLAPVMPDEGYERPPIDQLNWIPARYSDQAWAEPADDSVAGSPAMRVWRITRGSAEVPLAGAVQHAAVVPHDEVAGLPAVPVDARRLARVVEQLVEQRVGLVAGRGRGWRARGGR